MQLYKTLIDMYLKEEIQNRTQVQGRDLSTSEELRHNQQELDKNKIHVELGYEEASSQNTCWN